MKRYFSQECGLPIFQQLVWVQLVMLIRSSGHLFSNTKETGSVKDLKTMIAIGANDYWHYHYLFDEESDLKIRLPGKQMIGNILSNTTLPVRFFYGLHLNIKKMNSKWPREIPLGKYSITKGFGQSGYSHKNTSGSQISDRLTYLIATINFTSMCDRNSYLKK